MEHKYVIWMLRGAAGVSITLVVGYILFLCLIVTHTGQYDEFVRHILDTANGAILGAISSGVVGFWLGSSIGSLLKGLRQADNAQIRAEQDQK